MPLPPPSRNPKAAAAGASDRRGGTPLRARRRRRAEWRGSGLPDFDLPLALVAVVEAEHDRGILRESRRPLRVHGAAGVEAVVQLPQVTDVVGGALGEAGVERQISLSAESMARHHGLASAELRVSADGSLSHRTVRRGERRGGQVHDLVVGEELRLVLDLVEELDGVVGRLIVGERAVGQLGLALDLATDAVGGVHAAGDVVQHFVRELAEGDEADHRFALPAFAFFAAGFFPAALLGAARLTAFGDAAFFAAAAFAFAGAFLATACFGAAAVSCACLSGRVSGCFSAARFSGACFSGASFAGACLSGACAAGLAAAGFSAGCSWRSRCFATGAIALAAASSALAASALAIPAAWRAFLAASLGPVAASGVCFGSSPCPGPALG